MTAGVRTESNLQAVKKAVHHDLIPLPLYLSQDPDGRAGQHSFAPVYRWMKV